MSEPILDSTAAGPVPVHLYIPLTADVEMQVSFTAREFDGIASDPHTRLRTPTLAEMMAAVRTIRQTRGDQIFPHPTLPYPLA